MLQTSKEFYMKLSEKTGKTQAECKEFWEATLEMIFEESAKKDESSTILPKFGKVITRVDPGVRRSIKQNNEQVIVKPTRQVHVHLFPKAISKFNQAFRNK